MPLLAVSFAAAMVFINFSSGRPDVDWRVWLPPSLLQDLIRSPFSNISPTLSEAEALEEPRVRFFMFRAEDLNDFALHLEMLVVAFVGALMWVLLWAVVARRRASRSRPI
jgi:hypothetical protein